MQSTRNFMRLSIFAGVAFLAACGGGGGGSDGGSPAAAESNSVVSGKAIDGYLVNAKVCFDDGQGACDATQPSTVTDSTGSYRLSHSGNITGRQIDVIVTPDTKDLSAPTVPFASTFTLAAKVEGTTQNVTPFTTLVVAQTTTGKSEDEAVAAVRAMTGVTTDLAGDYISGGDTQSAAVAASMVSQLQATSGSGAISWSRVQATMNAYAAKGTTEISAADVLSQLRDPKFSTAVDASAVLAQPIYTIDGAIYATSTDVVNNSYVQIPTRESFGVSTDGAITNVTELQGNGVWNDDPSPAEHDLLMASVWQVPHNAYGAYVLKADATWSGFQTAAQLHDTLSEQSLGSTLIGKDAITGDTVTVDYRAADVSGQPLSTALQVDYRNPVRASMTGVFPTNTTAYLATITHANDLVYLINNGIGQPLVNGQALATSTISIGATFQAGGTTNDLPFTALGDPLVTHTTVADAVGTQTDVGGGCVALNILANGVATLDVTNKSGCNNNYPISLPVKGTWSVYPRNPNIIAIQLPKSVGAANIAIDDRIKNVVNAGGSLVVALMGGHLLGGFMLPASAPQTVAQFRAGITDLAAASMRTAMTSLGLQQNQ